MLSNTVLKDEGMRILCEKLGMVEAERFIALIRRESFDYTQWRQSLYEDVPLEKFLRDAQEYRERSEREEARESGKAERSDGI